MLHKEFFGLMFLLFVGWIVIAANPQQRIERTCAPLLWVGNLTTSVTALALPSQQQRVQKAAFKVEYACRYSVWRLLYQDEYNEYLAKKQQGLTAEESGAPKPLDTPAEESAESADPSEAKPEEEKAPKKQPAAKTVDQTANPFDAPAP